MTRTGVTGGRVRLSTVAFDLLWERLDLGAYPLIFPLLSHGATDTERVRLLDGARQELLADGVLVGPDVAPHVETWLRVLAAPAEEVHVRRVATTGVLRGTVVRGLAGGDPDPCLRAVLVDGAVHLEPAHPGGVVAAAVDLLPASGPGPGGQLSAPTDGLVAAFTAGASGPEAFAVAAHGLGLGREDALALGRALATTHATAQLGVATTRGGTRTPHPRVVVVHDTAQGRYVVTERPSPDGTPWSTLRPATSAQVARAVAELLAESRA